MRHFMPGGFYGHGWPMIFSWIFWLLIIAAIVWLIVRLVNSNKHDQKSSALDILKERYAKGEITEDEFKKIEKEIRS